MSYEDFYMMADTLEDVFFDIGEGCSSLDALRKFACAQALMSTCETLNNTAQAMEGAL